MAILCFLGSWVLYIWVVQKFIRSAAGVKAKEHVQIPDTVPSEWIEAYRAENDA